MNTFICGGSGNLSPEAKAELQEYAEYLKVPKPRPDFHTWRVTAREIASLRRERDAMRHVFAWLLGEEGEFPSPPETIPGKPIRRYWWRGELRERWDDCIRLGPDNPENAHSPMADNAEFASALRRSDSL